MTRDEVLLAGELYERVIFDLDEKQYIVRAVSEVIANDEERARHCPRISTLVTLIDPNSGERKKAGPRQLTLANPEMFNLKLKARSLAEKRK